MTTDLVDQLSTALDATGHVIAAVGDHQWTAPTPCTEWDVRELVDHVVGGNNLFTNILLGIPPTERQNLADIGHDPSGVYRDSASNLLAAFGQPGVLERMVTVPFGTVPGSVALHLRITEVLVHGWDLARATGQHATFPEDIAAQELSFSRSKLTDLPAGRTPFAPSQPTVGDAPAIDQLAACLGRSVNWQPAPTSGQT